MKIIVNHLTRIDATHICVAGVDPATNRHIRPVLFNTNLTTAYLANQGGYFGLGHSLDLGWVQAVGKPPEVEDVRFEPRKIRRQPQVTPKEFWQILDRLAQPTLGNIFGPQLKQNGTSAIVELGTGQASLGCLRLVQPPRLSTALIDNRDRPRISLNDGQFDLSLAITDLRFYEADQTRINRTAFEQAVAWCESGTPIILSVGLTRGWPKDNPRHWLQVNNLHFENQPLWLN